MKALLAGENLLLAAVLALMALLPLVEILLRSVFHTGLSGAAALGQHFGLVVSMLGAALAARHGRLLSLSPLPALLRGQTALLARFLTSTVAAIVAALLAFAGLQLVLAEYDSGNTIVQGIPVWLGQAALPLGFTLIAVRLAFASSSNWASRVAALALAAGAVLAAANAIEMNNTLGFVALGVLLIATLLGAPVFSALGGAALILFWCDGLPLASVALDQYRMVVNPSLPMIPLFTLAGYLLAEGGAPRRLIRIFNALFGGIHGGAALVSVLACVFFTSFTGASGVTIIALGGVLMPLLVAAGYSEKNALGLLAGAGSLGGLLPPGLPLVLYAIVASIAIDEMFLAGLVPGLLMVALIMCWGLMRAPHAAATPRKFAWKEASAALREAKWELLLPVVALAALFGGFATPVEAAAVTAVYAFVIEVFVYRDLDLKRDAPRVIAEAGLVIGGVLLILGVALGVANYLVDARVPELIADWAIGTFHSPWTFLLALNAFLLIAGCLLDMFSAIVVLVPLLVPLGAAFGIDPLHLALVFLINMELGYLTPPVGMNLFFTAYRFGKPLPEVSRAAAPVACVLAAGVLLVTFIPWLSTALPRLAR